RAPRVRLWDIAAGKEVLRFEVQEKSTDPAHRFGVFDAVFSPDGKTLATSGPGRTVRLWDVATGKERRRLALGVSVLAFSPGGETLAVAEGPQGKTIRLIDAASGKDLHPPGAHHQGVRFTSITSDGRTVATATGDGPIQLWDPKSGRERGRLEGNTPARGFHILGD